MKQFILLYIIFIICSKQVLCQKDTTELKIVLIGDAGAFIKGNRTAGSSLTEGWHPVITAIKRNVKMDSKTVVLFLGDNIYKEGLPDEQLISYKDAKAVLDTQINLVNNTAAKAIFIPGNHDWSNGARSGLDNVRREQQYIDLLSRSNVMYYPKEGCPGPIAIQVSEHVVIVVVDSQWWLHPHEKPGIQSDCENKTPDQILSELDEIVSKNANKLIVFASHHPFKSTGIHGGFFTLKQHLFPFTDLNKNYWIPMPLIGSVYPITRSVFGTKQDMSHPWYRDMVKRITEVMKKHPNVIYTAGHEHSLQLIKDTSYYIVSGGGCKQTRVSKSKHTLFAKDRLGYAVMHISKNKNVDINFYTVAIDNAAIDTAYSASLLNFSRIPEVAKKADTSTVITINYKDSVKAIANRKYDRAKGFKRWMLGDNYRKEWATPITLNKLELNKEKGGLTIISLGGGKQTKSLRLQDKTGKEWVLRTVNKDPETVLPENFRNSIAESILQDMMSASHPYAALTVSPLSKAINVQSASPQLFFVPDDPAFGAYREAFANTICMLEERAPTNNDTKSTAKTLEKIIGDNDHRVDQKAALRARLLDMIIGDFDRHFDQWRFEERDTGKGKLYIPIPRDRDQAYFHSNGLLLKIVAKTRLKYLKGFRKDIPVVEWFNYTAKDFDRIFLNRLTENDWKKELQFVQQRLTDSLIEKSIKRLPEPVYALNGKHIEEKMESRRDLLSEEAIKYYRFISKEVNILGSNKSDYFKLSGEHGKVRVKVYKRAAGIDTASLFYDRLFDPSVTKEIRLYGLNDNDLFEMLPNTQDGIKIRIVGGMGNDTFYIQGNAKTYLYDITGTDNYVLARGKVKRRFSEDPYVNYTDIVGYRYDALSFPMINVGYNIEDQLLVGLGFQHINYGFRKEPYASKQKLTTLYAPSFGNYLVRYNGEFNQVLGNLDIVANATYVHPTLDNFFGLGNETTADKNERSFYRIRYNYVEGNVLLRRRFFDLLHISFGPSVYHYWNRPADNVNKILAQPNLIGLDSSIFTTRTYAGAKLGLLIDNLENELFPTRGISWYTSFTSMYGLNIRSKPYSAIQSDMNVYAALSDPANFVTILRIGGGHIFSDDFEYFQAMSLGQNNYLRGFRKNRFSGSSMFYSSLEFRIKLFENKSSVIPGNIGLIVFNDIGRVWMKAESSRTWHYSYGGGLYFAPFNAVFISATAALSKEETLFNFTLGTKFNLTF